MLILSSRPEPIRVDLSVHPILQANDRHLPRIPDRLPNGDQHAGLLLLVPCIKERHDLPALQY
jgi:hypothetical protein